MFRKDLSDDHMITAILSLDLSVLSGSDIDLIAEIVVNRKLPLASFPQPIPDSCLDLVAQRDRIFQMAADLHYHAQIATGITDPHANADTCDGRGPEWRSAGNIHTLDVEP